MLVKTDKLDGTALDWAVAQCDGVTVGDAIQTDGYIHTAWDKVTKWENACEPYRPSSDWAQAGPIIQRERINIEFCNDLRDTNGLYIHAEMGTHSHHGYWRGDHEKPLVAAMRCYVKSKLGHEVDIPDGPMFVSPAHPSKSPSP
jgi:hypothetical protein